MENAAFIRQKVKQAYFILSEILQLLPVEYGNLHFADDDPQDAKKKPDEKTVIFPIGRQPAPASSADNHFCDFPALTTGGKSKQATEGKDKAKYRAFWKNYKKEISEMALTTQEKIKKAIAKKARYHNRVYEKRSIINGITVFGCAATVEECEVRFLADLTEKLMIARTDPEKPKSKRNVLFSEWSDIWFTKIYQYSVIPYTYERQLKIYRKHVLPFFGTKKIADISFLDCMEFFNLMREKDIERTTESCYWLLSRIFSAAYEEELIKKNPMTKIKPIKHERVNGTPLTKEEERAFLKAVRGTDYELLLVMALYTGLRPCELSTARIEGDFVIAQNRKQKNVKKIVYKKIPITPMLRPYRQRLEESLPTLTESFSPSKYTAAFKAAMPNHRPYDLRDTFSTRAQECGVPETVVQIFMGHSPKTLLGKVYTKFSDTYLLEEGEKIKY